MKGKGKGMAYHGGKSRVGKKNVTPQFHVSPSMIQTLAGSSKNAGMGYCPPGLKKGK